LLIGIYPDVLYGVLPYPVDYTPYTVSHVLTQLELLVFSALAFTLLMLAGLYPAEMRAIHLDADWLYRQGARAFLWFIYKPMGAVGRGLGWPFFFQRLPRALLRVGRDPIGAAKIQMGRAQLLVSGAENKRRLAGRIEADLAIDHGDLLQNRSIGSTLLWVSFFLLAYLLVYHLG
jgi:multicomponent Na+:H+ antiporter subunit D